MLNRILIVLLVFSSAFFAPALALHAQDKALPETSMQMKLSFAPLVKKVAPAVVNIYAKRTVSNVFRNPFADDPLFGMLFDRHMFGGRTREQVESALGSGVIVTEEGLVVTNAHVVKGAQEIRIVLSDGNEYAARLVLSDEASDLALLRVTDDEVSLPFAKLTPSESLEVGDLVLAIGNPFGVGQTVTSGIVSAQGRSSLDINDYDFFIQTDAAINPGNSGGPLVDMNGGVVGINTAIYSRSGGSLGIGFAIPSEMVASVIAAEYAGQTGSGGIIRPWLGVETQDVSPDIALSLDMLSPRGVLVTKLHKSSPLKVSGVRVGDVLVSLKGRPIQNASELKFRMATVPIGQSADLKLMRKGKEISYRIDAIAPPEVPARNETELVQNHVFKGAIVANLNPALAIELGLPDDEVGVVVTKSSPRLIAAGAFRKGDILLTVNGQDILDVSDVDRALIAERQAGAYLVMKRNGRVSSLYLR